MIRSRLLLSLIAGAAAAWGTLAVTEPLGPGLDPDGMSYVHAARSLVHQGEMRDVRDDWVSADSTRPYTRWPPAYPAAIALPVAAGMPAVQGARAVMAASAFAALATLVWLVGGAAGTEAGAVLALALLLTPAMAYVHESVLSEPLFLAALAATLAMMARPRPAPLRAGAAAAAASMVRYAGLSAIAAAAAWELLRAGTVRDRVRRAALAAAPGALVNLWWWTRAARLGGRTAVRHFSVYGQVGPTLLEGGRTVSEWLAPAIGSPWNAWAALALLIALAMTVGRSALRSRAAADDARRLAGAALVLLACYAGLVAAARLLADPDIPLDERILAPAIMLGTVIAAAAGARWWRGAGGRARAAAAVLGAAWCAGSFAVERADARYALRTGDDYADICWAGSPVTAWVREHGDGHALVSNASVALFFHAGRLAREMPDELSAPMARAFTDTLAARRAYVVLYDESCASTIEQPDSLVAALGLAPVARLRTGTVWEARARAAPRAPR